MIGDEQLQWLAADLKQQPRDANVVVLTHRPLFDDNNFVVPAKAGTQCLLPRDTGFPPPRE